MERVLIMHDKQNHPSTMTITKQIKDPLGTSVQITDRLLAGQERLNMTDISKAIQTPNFVIDLPNDRRYYFRKQGWEQNVMLMAQNREEGYRAESVVCNPETGFVNELLSIGTVIPFL
jgi:hypothetical protein